MNIFKAIRTRRKVIDEISKLEDLQDIAISWRKKTEIRSKINLLKSLL